MQRHDKWKLILCVESARALNLLVLIIVVYAIDVSQGWIIIVREYIHCSCQLVLFYHLGLFN